MKVALAIWLRSRLHHDLVIDIKGKSESREVLLPGNSLINYKYFHSKNLDFI